MITAPRKPRKYYSKARKMDILRELESSSLSLSDLARKHDVHPVTVHSWKQTLRENMKKPEAIDIAELFLGFSSLNGYSLSVCKRHSNSLT